MVRQEEIVCDFLLTPFVTIVVAFFQRFCSDKNLNTRWLAFLGCVCCPFRALASLLICVKPSDVCVHVCSTQVQDVRSPFSDEFTSILYFGENSWKVGVSPCSFCSYDSLSGVTEISYSLFLSHFFVVEQKETSLSFLFSPFLTFPPEKSICDMYHGLFFTPSPSECATSTNFAQLGLFFIFFVFSALPIRIRYQLSYRMHVPRRRMYLIHEGNN